MKLKGSVYRRPLHRWSGESRALILRIPESEVCCGTHITIKKRDGSPKNASASGSCDAFMGIYKPLKRGSSGTNLWKDKSAAYFVPYFTGLPHSSHLVLVYFDCLNTFPQFRYFFF